MIACVSHGGTWEDENKSEDEILAKEVPDIDLIISGHTHTELKEAIQHGNIYRILRRIRKKSGITFHDTETGRTVGADIL